MKIGGDIGITGLHLFLCSLRSDTVWRHWGTNQKKLYISHCQPGIFCMQIDLCCIVMGIVYITATFSCHKGFGYRPVFNWFLQEVQTKAGREASTGAQDMFQTLISLWNIRRLWSFFDISSVCEALFYQKGLKSCLVGCIMPSSPHQGPHQTCRHYFELDDDTNKNTPSKKSDFTVSACRSNIGLMKVFII